MSIKYWMHQFRYWFLMFAGKSYFHQSQGFGRVFVPGQLKGYFNDLSAKTDWHGHVDEDGIAYTVLADGRSCYFPIFLTQKALGHWDSWLMFQKESDKIEFLRVADWLVGKQDSNGGWDTWTFLGKPEQLKYSSMTQGQALSVLSRAFSLTQDSIYERAARRAVGLFLKTVEEGGVTCKEDQDVFLEEFPSLERATVLNGWIFSVFGLYDFLIAFKDDQIQNLYNQTLKTLIKHLPEYDAGYWSVYSIGIKRIASPFYHNLHVAQLMALEKISDDDSFKIMCKKWQRYNRNILYKAVAIIIKIYQKLLNPVKATMVG